MKIVCVGHAAYDITMLIDQFIEENEKQVVLKRLECGGGQASNTAYLLGKWGMSPSFIGMIGRDFYGKQIRDEFRSVSVDIEHLEIRSDYITPSSIILVNQQNGSRTVLKSESKSLTHEPVTLQEAPDLLFFDGEELEVCLTLFEQYPNAIKILNAGRTSAGVLELLTKVDHVIASKSFAESMTGLRFEKGNSRTYYQLFQEVQKKVRGTLIITLGEDGCIYESNHEMKLMPAFAVEEIDTTGAGDVFAGAYIYGLATNMQFEERIKLATVAAGVSVSKLGTRNSMIGMEELKELYDQSK